MNTETATIPPRPVVSRDEWLVARRRLLDHEKAHTRAREKLAAERRELPWVRIDQPYVFDGPDGATDLAGLFGPHQQLIVYHFMFGPDWDEGCRGCSFVSDHLEGTLAHLAARGIRLVAVSRAPLEKFAPFQQRMGWKFPWYSSARCDFNHDFHVSFTPEELAAGPVDYNYSARSIELDELPGLSVFVKKPDGSIYHTYSTYSRGLEPLLATYSLIDLTPRGRDEDPEMPMSWVRHHDRYDAVVTA